MLDLYHGEPVANSMKVLFCFKEKQLDFVSHYMNLLKFEQHKSEFVKINPNGQVPVLVHDGKVITESTVINEYVDEVFPAIPMKPSDPYWRARMRIWTKYSDEYFLPALSVLGWHTMVRQVAKAIPKAKFEELLAHIPLAEQRKKWATIAGDSFPAEELAECRRKLRVSAEKMEKDLRESTWLAGPTFSLADIDVYPAATGLVRFAEIDMAKQFPRVADWLASVEARPGFKAARAMPDTTAETLREYAKG